MMKGQWGIIWNPSLVTVRKKCQVCLHCEPNTGNARVGHTRGLSTDVRNVITCDLARIQNAMSVQRRQLHTPPPHRNSAIVANYRTTFS